MAGADEHIRFSFISCSSFFNLSNDRTIFLHCSRIILSVLNVDLLCLYSIASSRRSSWEPTPKKSTICSSLHSTWCKAQLFSFLDKAQNSFILSLFHACLLESFCLSSSSRSLSSLRRSVVEKSGLPWWVWGLIWVLGISRELLSLELILVSINMWRLFLFSFFIKKKMQSKKHSHSKSGAALVPDSSWAQILLELLDTYLTHALNTHKDNTKK